MGGRRRKNRFIPILGIASVYVYMYLLHTTGITALVCTCVVVRGWSTVLLVRIHPLYPTHVAYNLSNVVCCWLKTESLKGLQVTSQ